MSKRQSLMPAAPPTPVHIVSDRRCSPVVMADVVSVVGTFPVTISGDTVIHPRSKLDAKGGPVNIGRRCIVEERAVVGGAATSINQPGVLPEGSVTLADYVSVESGALIDAGVAVGKGSVIGPKCQIGTGAVIGMYCTLSPRTIIAPGERLPDFTVVYGPQRRRDGRPASGETRHRVQNRKLEVLQKLIPNMSDKYVPANPLAAV